jgi:flagellar basal-body rod modification protein FlgD
MSVVGTKIGTKSWSDSPQSESARPPIAKTNSAQDLEQFNGEDVGDIANKVADPNYVDPSKRVRAVGSDKLDKDAFMKLMLAQMKNQDPTNPLKSHEMAAQLAQFSGLEQMQNINTTLTELLKAQKPTESFQALNFIGKAVSGDSARVSRMKGDKSHDFNFTLPDDAKDIDIKVRNTEGEIIRNVTLHDMKKGENKFQWNGQNDAGASVPVGDYQFMIEAKGSNGKKLFVQTDFSGIISGVSYTNEGPVLMVGNQSVKLKDVRRIVDPSLDASIKNNGQKAGNLLPPDLQKAGAAAQTEDKGAQEVFNKGNIATAVGMSSEMLDKFKQDTAKPQASMHNTPGESMSPEEEASLRAGEKPVEKPAEKVAEKAATKSVPSEPKPQAKAAPKAEAKPVMKPESKPEHKASEPTKDERALASKGAAKKHGA